MEYISNIDGKTMLLYDDVSGGQRDCLYVFSECQWRIERKVLLFFSLCFAAAFPEEVQSAGQTYQSDAGLNNGQTEKEKEAHA